MVTVFCAATSHLVDVSDLCYCWELCWYAWSELLTETVLISLSHASVGNHVDNCVLYCHQKPCWCTCSELHSEDEFYPRPNCWWRPCWCLWSVLAQEGILFLVIRTATYKHVMLLICVHVRDQIDVSFPSCHQKPSWGPWSVLLLGSMLKSITVLPLETIWKLTIYNVTHFYRQGSFFSSSINDWRMVTENNRHWRLCCHPSKQRTV